MVLELAILAFTIAGPVVAWWQHRSGRRRLCYLVMRPHKWTEHWAAIRMAVWNGGGQPLFQSDIGAPIVLTSPGASRIESVHCVTVTERANNLSVVLAPDTSLHGNVIFGYLNPADGAVYDVRVVTTKGCTADLELRGSLIGSGIPQRRHVFNLGTALYYVALFAMGMAGVLRWVNVLAPGSANLTHDIRSAILSCDTRARRFIPATLLGTAATREVSGALE